jgi:hypothetical protein
MAGYNSFNLDFGMAQRRQETLRQERAEGRLAREARRAARQHAGAAPFSLPLPARCGDQ